MMSFGPAAGAQLPGLQGLGRRSALLVLDLFGLGELTFQPIPLGSQVPGQVSLPLLGGVEFSGHIVVTGLGNPQLLHQLGIVTAQGLHELDALDEVAEVVGGQQLAQHGAGAPRLVHMAGPGPQGYGLLGDDRLSLLLLAGQVGLLGFGLGQLGLDLAVLRRHPVQLFLDGIGGGAEGGLDGKHSRQGEDGYHRGEAAQESEAIVFTGHPGKVSHRPGTKGTVGVVFLWSGVNKKVPRGSRGTAFGTVNGTVNGLRNAVGGPGRHNGGTGGPRPSFSMAGWAIRWYSCVFRPWLRV